MNFMRHRAWPGFLALVCLLTFFIAPTPLPGIEGRAYAASGPDLVIQSITWSPQTPYIGNKVSFTVNVKNQGDSPAASVRIGFYIDNDIADYTYISQINPGGTAACIFYWKAVAGAHIVTAAVDSDDMIIETDENNNEKSYAFSVMAPDLVIESISWTPENPSSGETVAYTIIIKNNGNKSATASKVGFFIDERLYANRDVTALNAGEEAAITCSIIAKSGLHKIEAFADVLNQVKESDETNNTKTVTCISAVPDLVIHAFTWTPEDRGEGDNITASVTIKNNGSGNASYSSLVLYIDEIYEASAFVEPLNAGTAVVKTFSCAVNANGHTLKAIIDAAGMVTESNEVNNYKTVTVPAIAPDLIIQSITWSPTRPLIAHMMHFTITIKNQGVRQSSNCGLDFYIGGSLNLNARIGPLGPNATCSVSFPWLTQTEFLSVTAVIDEENIIKESNESNNTASASVGFSKPAPNTDLSIQSFTCAPSVPSPGENVAITAVVKNLGPGAAGPSHVACYVDDVLFGFIYVGELGPGATVEKSILWPAESGEHEIRIIIDCNDSILETNELNNESTTYIIATAPDLIIEKIEWFPLSPAIGKDILYTLTIKNQGNRASGNCYITYYIDGSTQGNHYLDNIGPGESTIRNFSWNMQSSSHTFLAAIDEANVVLESDENNNEKSVFLPAPDLTIESVACSEDYPVANTNLTFVINITNTGSSPASGTIAAVYIDNIHLATIEAGTINAGNTAESVITWTAVPGKHVLRIIADEADTITESNESDNTKEVIIFVPLPSAAGDEPQDDEADVTDNQTDTTQVPEESADIATPAIPEEILEILPEDFEEETEADISGNLSAAPDETSNGILGVLMNKWLLIGVAVVGIAAIAALLILRNRGSHPKTPKTPKPAKAEKPAAPKAAPGKEAVATAKPGAAPAVKPAPAPGTVSAAGPAAAQAPAPPKPAAPPPAQAPPPQQQQ